MTRTTTGRKKAKVLAYFVLCNTFVPSPSPPLRSLLFHPQATTINDNNGRRRSSIMMRWGRKKRRESSLGICQTMRQHLYVYLFMPTQYDSPIWWREMFWFYSTVFLYRLFFKSCFQNWRFSDRDWGASATPLSVPFQLHGRIHSELLVSGHELWFRYLQI